MKRAFALVSLLAILDATPAHAHIGSPDVYAQGDAGPYHLSIVVRPPLVIPGVADIEVRAQTPGLEHVTITPVPLTGEASLHPPVPDAMDRTTADPNFFTGHLWIMDTGSWQIRFAVNGAQGQGALAIPFPATAQATLTMQPTMGLILAALGIILVLGMVGIVGAAARESKLEPGSPVPAANRRKAAIAMTAAFSILVALLILGNVWWRSEASSYSSNIYKPLQMAPSVLPGNILNLKLRDPGWLSERKLDDLIPDHDHIMHLYLVRWPQMDVVYHLHPDPVLTGEFQLPLPTLPAGAYRLYADIVHSIGFPETITGSIDLPAITGRPLAGDDARGTASPVGSRELAISSTSQGPIQQRFALPSGYTMVWSQPGSLATRAAENFTFTLLDPAGHPPADMKLYMGMLGHAAFIKADGSVFAHIHPTGTMAMAAFMMANPQAGSNAVGHISGSMTGMSMPAGALPNSVSFPYGFPTPGDYRIFVQMKHGDAVETGAFDATVPAR